MKIQIILEKIYTLKINGREYPGFKKASEWEGFIKFERDGASVTVFKGCNDLSGLFTDIFGWKTRNWMP